MRACAFLALALALSGCKPPASTIATPSSQNAPATDGPPWSEGTANKKLKGLTDDELKALIGAPDVVSQSPDLQFIEWRYAGGILKPAEGSSDTKPSGVIVCLRDGTVRKLIRLPR